MQRTRVKICGITRPQDALAAVAAGADEIGMILHAPSKRLVSMERAREIARIVPASVSVVGVFVDAEPALILDLAGALQLAAVQLHGRENGAMIKALRPWAVRKAVGVVANRLKSDLRDARRAFEPPPYQKLDAVLLDTAGEGGSGKSNDWEAVAQLTATGGLEGSPPWIAAGGLTPGTAGDIVKRLRPSGVDVSSGVEERPGEKSAALIRDFIQAVREADASV